MEPYRAIARHFQDIIESIATSVDDLAGPIERGSQLMTSALLTDRKIIACGAGVDAAVARLLVSSLLSGIGEERPALPAVQLNIESAGGRELAEDNTRDKSFARQLRALGQPGDVLVCVDSGENYGGMHTLVATAGERNIGTVALSNASETSLNGTMRSEDVFIPVSGGNRRSVINMHTMIVNCLCEMIDYNLFGSNS